MDPAQNLAQIKDRIKGAALKAGRSPDDVTLVAISKFHGHDRIEPVLAAGQKVFGENRVQEAQGKWPPLVEAYPDVELHLVGPLQTNKVKDAVRLFDAIHSLDRERLARKLAQELSEQEKSLALFIEVNTGEEEQKAGIVPSDADAFVRLCREELKLPIQGLMCIPPVNENPAPHFALLRKIAQRNGLAGLSMGMTSDFETAIELGATHVRVGTAIFGERPPPENNV